MSADKPELFAVIGGVPVYHVHKHGYTGGRRMTYWYSLAADNPERHWTHAFDVRRFGVDPHSFIYDSDEALEDGIRRGIELALGVGLLQPPGGPA